ncbi:MAG TPA: sugar ABC transporter permease [Candidatus Acidoferrum sp.]|nr:sugar ABC transporter permease [Candidatus Acidoferrum sp.]
MPYSVPPPSQAVLAKRLSLPHRAARLIDRQILFWLLLPAFLVLFATTVGPFLWSLGLSFTDFNLANPGIARFVGLDTYRRVLASASTWNALFNTVYMVAAIVVSETLLGLALALVLARQFPGVRVVRSLFLIPLMTPSIVVALTWRMLFNTRFGYINYFLGLLGVPQEDWLGDPLWAMPSLIISDVWVAAPFVASIVLAGLLSLPEEPFEAATVDGASPFQIFWNITLPLLRPVLALAVMFRSIDAFRKFESIQIMTGGGPGDVTMTVNFLVYNTGFLFLRLADASVLAVIMVALMFLIVVACVRWIERQ